MIRLHTGEPIKLLRSIYPQIYKWCKNYALVTNGETFILVAHPDDVIGVAVVDETVDMDTVKRIIYFEAAYTEIKRAYSQDHTKGRTLYACLGEQFENIGHELCKMFTGMCPICITPMKRNQLVAGMKSNHHTRFWDLRAGGSNQLSNHARWRLSFLMNYINHGVKFLFSIPPTCKRESYIAIALLEIFTVVGPPMILQLDNGNEFNTLAMPRKQVGEFCGK